MKLPVRKNRLNFGSSSATVCGSRYSSKSAKSSSARLLRLLRERRLPMVVDEPKVLEHYPLFCHHRIQSKLRNKNPTPQSQQRRMRSRQDQQGQTLPSNQRLCQKIHETASKPLVFNRCMGSKNQTMTPTTDIAKILCRVPSLTLRFVVRNDIANTLRTLWLDTLVLGPTAYAQSRKWVAQAVENVGEVVSSKRLKIRVSLVRFQSRPPDPPHSFARGCGVFLWALFQAQCIQASNSISPSSCTAPLRSSSANIMSSQDSSVRSWPNRWCRLCR